jgi:hypothetical protein
MFLAIGQKGRRISMGIEVLKKRIIKLVLKSNNIELLELIYRFSEKLLG